MAQKPLTNPKAPSSILEINMLICQTARSKRGGSFTGGRRQLHWVGYSAVGFPESVGCYGRV